MKRFKKILLVCDEKGPPQSVIDRACALANANDASLTLIDVMQRGIGDYARFLSGMTERMTWDLEQQVFDEREKRMHKIAADIEKRGVSVTCLLAHGVAFIEIIGEVLRNGHDLVMKVATGNREGRNLFFGSLDLHLLRKCPCPVWVIKQSQRKKYDRILAAVDPHGTDAERNGLNTMIMDLATSLSEIEKSELQIVNAWQFEGERMLRSNPRIKLPDAELDKMVRLERKNRKALLDSVVEDYTIENRRRQLHLIKGDARVVIPEIARKKRVELIVMGTVARTGISGLLIGNTAESILNQIDCSVMAVKPIGFETPVKVPSSDKVPDRLELVEQAPA